MDLSEAAILARLQLDKYNLHNWSFEFMNSKRCFGRCYYYTHIIKLSKHLTLANSQEQVLNCLLHEIAHALVPLQSGHNSEWRKIALSIGNDAKSQYDPSQVVTNKKWIGICPDCGFQAKRHNRRKNTRHIGCINNLTWRLSV